MLTQDSKRLERPSEIVQGRVVPKSWRTLRNISRFARRKPLGFVSALVLVIFIIIGDLVPVSVNTIYHVLGSPLGGGYASVKQAMTAIEGKPVPYIGSLVAPYAYDQNHPRDRLQDPSARYKLGTDELGRDVLSRLIYGARVSIVVPFGAVLITQLMATGIGIMSAFYGGLFDKTLQRFVDLFQALPGLVVLITVLGLLGSGLWQLIIIIGILGGPSSSRIIRAQALAVMVSPYLEAGRSIGASNLRLMTTYVLPNVMALIILGATLRLGAVVLIEASLSFLGYGLPPPFPSWGQMLSLQGREYMKSAPGLAIFPGLAIAIIVFSYNLLGDALRDTLDPRLRGST